MKTLLLVLLCSNLACKGVKDEKPDVGRDCAKVGDACEIEPGKLGVCIDSNVSGQGAQKLVCQSQH